MRRAVLALVLVACGAAAPKEDEGKKDLARLQGDWACESLVSNGMALEADDAQALFRTMKGDRYTLFRFNKPLGKGTFTLDAGKVPRAIDALPAGPAGKGGPLRGIYKLDGDKLTLCFAGPGKERPAAFAAKAGSGHTLSVWVREKK